MKYFRYKDQSRTLKKLVVLDSLSHSIVDGDISWHFINNTKSKNLMVIGQLKKGTKYLCSELSYDLIFMKLQALKSNRAKIEKRGLHKKIIKAIVDHLGVKEDLKAIGLEGFKQFIKVEYKVEL